MEYLVGLALAAGICLFVRLVGLDRDRALYPAMVLVVASYYALFAVMSGSLTVLMQEVAGIAVFVALAVASFRISLWYAVAALAAHGVFDGFHARIITDPGVPDYWPGFCMTFDVVAAIWLAGLLLTSWIATPPVLRAPSGRRAHLRF